MEKGTLAKLLCGQNSTARPTSPIMHVCHGLQFPAVREQLITVMVTPDVEERMLRIPGYRFWNHNLGTYVRTLQMKGNLVEMLEKLEGFE